MPNRVFTSERRDPARCGRCGQSVTTGRRERRAPPSGGRRRAARGSTRRSSRQSDAQPEQEAVEVPAALAEPVTVGREREPGHDDDVERGRVDVAGHHAQLRPVDLGREHVDPSRPAPFGPRPRVGLPGSASNNITWRVWARRSQIWTVRARSTMRRSAPRCGRSGRRGRRDRRRCADESPACRPQESLRRVHADPAYHRAMSESVQLRCLRIEGDCAPSAAACRSTPLQFRKVLGHFPTGVTIVTGLAGDEPAGFTIGSFTSVSLDPPLVGFLPQIASETWQAMAPDGRFCVNVLRDEQAELCWRFAKSGVGDDRFDYVTWTHSPTGCPIIEGIGAWIDCDGRALDRARRPLLRRRPGRRPRPRRRAAQPTRVLQGRPRRLPRRRVADRADRLRGSAPIAADVAAVVVFAAAGRERPRRELRARGTS